MATLTNIALNARSLNGVIVISDGGGTIIQDGRVNTDNLITETMTSTNMISTNMIVPRINTNLIPLLGGNINLTTLTQNMNFNTTAARQFEIWNDSATGQILVIDVSNNVIYINTESMSIVTNTLLNCVSPNLTFTNSSVSFPNSTVSFNSYLPTSTLTPSTGTQLITKTYGDSTYATLAGSNDFTGQCTFNAFLPTSFLNASSDSQFITRGSANLIYPRLSGATNAFTSTNTFNSSLPTSTITTTTGPTQFITRQIGDGRFGQLAAANIWTLQNTFRTGILPCRGSGANPESDIQIGGNNQFQYRQANSQYNIGIGALTIVGDSVAPANNIGKRNIGIGHQSLQTGDNINDCIAIGYQAMQNCGSIRVYTVACQRQIAIGSGSMQNGIYSTDSIAIGTNSLKNCTSGNGNIVIAHNGGVAQLNGSAVIIGSESSPTISDNGFVCVGYRTAGFATGSANRCVFVGEQAGLNNNNGYSNTHIGGLAGQNNTTGSQLTCIGTFAGGNGSINNAMNSVAIGCNAQYTDSWEFVIGGDDTLGGALSYPRLTLPTKNRINCCQFTGTPTTFTINWRTNEYVVVNSATCTQINLPQAISSNQNRVGAAFHICRTHLSTSNLVISAFGTEKINWKGTLHSSVAIDSWVMSISFVCVDNVAGNGVWTVFTYNDRVTLATDANRIQTISDSTNIDYPVCFTTIATTGYNPVYANSSLTYNPNTSLLTLQNLTTAAVNILNKVNLATNQNAVSNPTLSFSTGENVLLSDAGTTSITLPIPAAANIGTKFVITRNVTGLDITINSPVFPQTVCYTRTDGTFFATNAYTFSKFMQSITALCIATSGNTWLLIEGEKTVTASEQAGVAATFYPTFVSDTDGNFGVNTDSNLQYRPDTKSLLLPTGTFQAERARCDVFQYRNQNTLITSATTLTNPLIKSYYPFTMKTAAGYTITLPEVTATSVGTQLIFKRIGGSLQILTIAMSANQPSFNLGNAVGTLASYQLVGTTQGCGTMVAIQSQDDGAGTFSNTAGSTTVNITAQTSGTLSIGGKINLNGNVRWITGYSGTAPVGLGGPGNYVVNAAIATANTNAAYTSQVTYGWSVISVQ